MCQISPITREQLSRGADMRQHSGARVEIPRAPTGRAHRQSLRNSWAQRVTGAGLPLCKGSVMPLTTGPQNPSASVMSDKPQCTCPGSCSQCYLVLCFLGSTVFLPRQNLPPAAAGTGLWRTRSRKRRLPELGHSQVVAGSRLWLLLPGVRNPFQSFCGENFFLNKILNPVFPSPCPSPSDISKEEQ